MGRISIRNQWELHKNLWWKEWWGIFLEVDVEYPKDLSNLNLFVV